MRNLHSNKIVLATHNNGKKQEIAELLNPYGFEIQNITDFGFDVPKETGSNFMENAYIKAFSAACQVNLPALSDDSGLEIAILNHAPGIHTADWALQHDGTRDFAKAMDRIERELQAAGAITDSDRQARFVCVLCLCWPDGHAEYFQGEIAGTIVWPPRGISGFGLDPIFQPEGYSRSFGEMTSSEKHGWKQDSPIALSHRARAFKKLSESLLTGRAIINKHETHDPI